MFPRDSRTSAATASARWLVLLLTVAVAIVLAFAGVVLAQDLGTASPDSAEGDDI